MAKLPTKVVKLEPVNIPVTEVYTITAVMGGVWGADHNEGLRVTCAGKDGDEFNVMLWLKEEVGARSKLGSFISALGPETNDWVMRDITFVSWAPRNREIRVVEVEGGKRKTARIPKDY